MKNLKYYGTNLFLYGKVGNAYVMVGCASGYKMGVKNPAQDVSCPGNGPGKSYLPGKMPDYDLSFDGMSYVYSGQDLSTNIGVDIFWDNCALGTEIKIVKSDEAPNVDAPYMKQTTFIVESCDETGKFGEATTYSVAGKASGGWIDLQL